MGVRVHQFEFHSTVANQIPEFYDEHYQRGGKKMLEFFVSDEGT